MSGARFDDWGKPSDQGDGGKGNEAKAEGSSDQSKKSSEEDLAKKARSEAGDLEAGGKKDGSEESDQENQESDESPEVKGLKKELFKKREKTRELKERLAALEAENSQLKSKEELSIDDFDSFEDYEKAKTERSQPKKLDPMVADAIVDLNKKIEKAGLDVKEVTAALADMEYLPDKVLVSLADRKDAARIAQWLAANEDSEEAQAALNARTDIGRMRAMDDIADLIKATPKNQPTKTPDSSVETITRIPSGSKGRSLDGLSTEDFAQATKGRGGRRFW